MVAAEAAEAAEETKGLMLCSVERVESGSLRASGVGDVMQQFGAQIRDEGTVKLSIDTQVRLQAVQTTAISHAVRDIDAMTQQNAALVEQTAASAHGLRGQAGVMDDAVQAFRL